MKKFFKKLLLFLVLFSVIGLLLSRCEDIHNTEQNVRPETIIRTPEEYQKELERQVQQSKHLAPTLSAYAADVDTSAFENGTSFIGLPGVLNGLDIFFDVLDFSEPMDAGLQTVTVDTFYTFSGKHKLVYNNSAYEIVTLTISTCFVEGFAGTGQLIRSGSAGSTTENFYMTSLDITFQPSWGRSTLQYSLPADNPFYNFSFSTNSFFRGVTVNSIPETYYDYVLSSAECLSKEFSESYFITNNLSYQVSHDNIFSSNGFWSTPSVLYPLTSRTVINSTNVNDFSAYGFGVNADGNLTFDSDLMLSYNHNAFLPLFLDAYKLIYNNFPDIGVEFPDEGGNRNVLIVEEPPPEETTSPGSDIVVVNPVATLPPHWLEDTAYLDTSPDIVLETYDVSDIVEKSVLDSHIVQNAGGFIWLVSDFMQDNGLLSLVLFVVILSVIFAFLRF